MICIYILNKNVPTMQLIPFVFSTIIGSDQLGFQYPGSLIQIPFYQSSIGEVGHFHPSQSNPLQRGMYSWYYHDRPYLGNAK